VNCRSPTFSPKGVGGFYPPPPGEYDVREGGSYPPGVCVGAVSGGAACGRRRSDAVYDKEMMQPLDGVKVELC
jgi:hypothetical protein